MLLVTGNVLIGLQQSLASFVITSTPLFLAHAITVFMDPKSTPTTDILEER